LVVHLSAAVRRRCSLATPPSVWERRAGGASPPAPHHGALPGGDPVSADSLRASRVARSARSGSELSVAKRGPSPLPPRWLLQSVRRRRQSFPPEAGSSRGLDSESGGQPATRAAAGYPGLGARVTPSGGGNGSDLCPLPAAGAELEPICPRPSQTPLADFGPRRGAHQRLSWTGDARWGMSRVGRGGIDPHRGSRPGNSSGQVPGAGRSGPIPSWSSLEPSPGLALPEALHARG
jgi:hypothetical protein